MTKQKPFNITITSSSSSISTTTPAGNHDGDTPFITTIHADIIQSHILNKLDGPTLASTGCAATKLFTLCSDDQLWKDICNSSWPSTTDSRVREIISAFPSGHRSFYSDSFPSLHQHSLTNHPSQKTSPTRLSDTSEFISAVDVFYGEKLIYSKVLVTDTTSSWFQSSPFQVDLLESKDMVPTPLKYDSEDGACMSLAEERLRISWILIDPVKKRAVNVASSKSVEARRHWLTEDIQLRYATVVAVGGEMVQCEVVITCGGKEGGELHVREVRMQVEDIEGKILSGMDSLVILNEAMEGQRRKRDFEVEKGIYGKFLRMKVESRERKLRREKSLDLVFVATGVAIFFAILMFLLSW